ncbi:hypothetical protein M0811_09774 [Anaeramoeba ignava]|uniref:Uncharacterized protein n=1 Tax=Anaeramoeba ignava TaxID=1746090 RepID=A0A9Q0LG80_ANAIG|nr:hypothetical protein M0811_09774 [Anaeramoeba ignava]
MDLEEINEVAKTNLLTKEEINDISDFIENNLDGDTKENKKIIKKYRTSISWFKSKRVYIDPDLINLSGIESEKNAKEIKPKNLAKSEGIVDKYSTIVQGWIGKEIFNKMKLQFVSTKEDQLTCQDFHQKKENEKEKEKEKENENENQNQNQNQNQNENNENQNQNQNQNNENNENQNQNQKEEENEISAYIKKKMKSIEKDHQKIQKIEDNQSFLFILKSSKKDRQMKIELKEKPKKIGIIYYSKRGPIFGDGWDLSISADLKTGYSNPGCSYQLPNGIEFGSKEARTFFTQQYGEWEVDQLEVYF